MTIALSQPVHTQQSISLATVSCPGYGNVALSVGADPITNSLHYGAYSVTMDVSGDAPWTLTIEQSVANR